MNGKRRCVLGWVGLALFGCAEHVAPLRPPPSQAAPFVCDPEAEPPTLESVQWKRVAALTADLAGALELTAESLCREFDSIACRDVHRVSLGGNDPFGAAQWEPVESPLVTTPAVLDRLVLAACENAVARDETGTPRVFTELPPTASDADPAALEAQARILYRRLLGRDAEPEELRVVADLVVDGAATPRTAREADVLVCFAIGSTTEMALF